MQLPPCQMNWWLPGTMYQMCKDILWQGNSASSDEEFNTIITDMIQDAKNYGLDECNAYQINEAKLRKAAEDEALAANK